MISNLVAKDLVTNLLLKKSYLSIIYKFLEFDIFYHKIVLQFKNFTS